MGVSAVREPTHQEPTHPHVVGVYDHDDDLVVAVAQFLGRALDEDGTAIIVATAAHRAAVEDALTNAGYGPATLARSGAYIALDAADTLARFMGPDGPDAERFRASMESVLTRAPRPGPVHVFGEMVALLWDRGEIEHVMTLESLWNDLAGRHAFELLCAYAMSSLELSDDLGATKRMCDHHSGIVPLAGAAPAAASSTGTTSEHDRMFVAAPTVVRDVRRFVRNALGPWLDDVALDDTDIVASELATNAVNHARSPFRVSVSVAPGTVRIAVRDASFAPPLRLEPDGVLLGGRGVLLVAALSRAWGTNEEPDGKTVWAEIDRGRETR